MISAFNIFHILKTYLITRIPNKIFTFATVSSNKSASHARHTFYRINLKYDCSLHVSIYATMYVCAYVCLYICMNVCFWVYVCMCVHMCVCVYVSTFVRVHIYICIVYIDVCISACISNDVCLRVILHTWMHAHMSTRIHEYIAFSRSILSSQSTSKIFIWKPTSIPPVCGSGWAIILACWTARSNIIFTMDKVTLWMTGGAWQR